MFDSPWGQLFRYGNQETLSRVEDGEQREGVWSPDPTTYRRQSVALHVKLFFLHVQLCTGRACGFQR